jgi:hypothetical protein
MGVRAGSLPLSKAEAARAAFAAKGAAGDNNKALKSAI